MKTSLAITDSSKTDEQEKHDGETDDNDGNASDGNTDNKNDSNATNDSTDNTTTNDKSDVKPLAKTGDSMPVIPLVCLAVIASVVLTGALRLRVKH